MEAYRFINTCVSMSLSIYRGFHYYGPNKEGRMLVTSQPDRGTVAMWRIWRKEEETN